MKKVEVFSKKLDKSFVIAVTDEENALENGSSFDELYQGQDTDEYIQNDWSAWMDQGWNNWGAICV